MNIKNLPFVSVSICIYNGEKYLKQCINALIKQNYSKKKYEIILVDDGSKDASSEICKETIKNNKNESPLIQYALIKHSGLSVARNTCVYLSKGDIIAYIDQDAIADKNWIPELVKAFGEDKTIGVIGGKIEILNNKKFISRFIHIARYYQFFGPKIFKSHIIGTNMAYRKDVFKTLGGFYEFFTQRGDESSFLNKVFKKYKFAVAPRAIVYHEMPETLLSWLRLDYKEAYLGEFVKKTERMEQKNTFRRGIAYIQNIFISIFPALLISLLLFDSILFLWLFLTSSLFVFRKYIFKIEQRIIYRELFFKFKSFSVILLFIFLNWVSTVLGTIGILFGYFASSQYHPKEVIPSGNKIIKIITNDDSK